MAMEQDEDLRLITFVDLDMVSAPSFVISSWVQSVYKTTSIFVAAF